MDETKRLGNIYNENFGSGYAGNVWDINGCCPTITTSQGGGREPMICQNERVKSLGYMDNGTGKHQSNTVYDENAVCPNITTIEGGGTQQIKILTAEALRMVRTEDGKALRKQYENHEVHHGFNEYREPELRTDGVANTLSTVQKDNHICVAMRGRNPENPSDRTAGNPTEQRLEMNMQGTSNCLTSVQKDNLLFEPRYRIRKLTPRECGRLMGVSDEDISKMAAVNSNTQLYKQFGNSIVVDVMVAMFKNLGIEQKGVID